MKIIRMLLLSLSVFITFTGTTQPPQTPMINYAYQGFYRNPEATNTINHNLIVSQFISPRVMKPQHPNKAEPITIMFIGNWLDITDEIIVTGPNTPSGRGVNFSEIKEIRYGYGYSASKEGMNSLHIEYTGPYIIAKFFVASDAAIGTHVIKLRRPRLGPGKDEAVFYIEVYDAVRIHQIRFSRSLLDSGRLNAAGLVTITGQNLDRITSIGNCNGMLENISNFTKSANTITVTATLAKKGIIDYETLMNSVLPRGLKNAEYPKQFLYNVSGKVDPVHLTIW